MPGSDQDGNEIMNIQFATGFTLDMTALCFCFCFLSFAYRVIG